MLINYKRRKDEDKAECVGVCKKGALAKGKPQRICESEARQILVREYKLSTTAIAVVVTLQNEE